MNFAYKVNFLELFGISLVALSKTNFTVAHVLQNDGESLYWVQNSLSSVIKHIDTLLQRFFIFCFLSV